MIRICVLLLTAVTAACGLSPTTSTVEQETVVCGLPFPTFCNPFNGATPCQIPCDYNGHCPEYDSTELERCSVEVVNFRVVHCMSDPWWVNPSGCTGPPGCVPNAPHQCQTGQDP